MAQQKTYSGKIFRAAVLGGSISGLMSTLVLAKLGFKVALYEKRSEYNRKVQWGVRQSFINYLASIDNDIAKKFKSISSNICNDYRFLTDKCSLYKEGAYLHQQRNSPSDGAYVEQDLSGKETLGEEIVCLVPAKDLEKLLFKEVNRLKAVTIYRKESPQVKYEDSTGAYSLIEDEGAASYDLIVVCEGAASQTRDAVGISSMALSRPVAQVSGQADLKRYGMIIERLHNIQHEDVPKEGLLLSLLISTDRRKASWIVGDISSECLAKLNDNPDSSKEESIVAEEFRRVAARTMFTAEAEIVEARYQGVVQKLKRFDLQAKISNKAMAGNNLVLAGDAVGVGHWSVGGGMHVAGVCHISRLKVLASALKDSSDRQSALQKYNDGVLADTIAWISRGIKDYYLTVPRNALEAVFNKLIEELMKDNTIDFPKELKGRVASVFFGDSPVN